MTQLLRRTVIATEATRELAFRALDVAMENFIDVTNAEWTEAERAAWTRCIVTIAARADLVEQFGEFDASQDQPVIEAALARLPGDEYAKSRMFVEKFCQLFDNENEALAWHHRRLARR